MKKVATIIFRITIISAFIILLSVFLLKGFAKLRELFPGYEKAHASEIFEGIEEDYTYVVFEDQPIVLNHYPVILENKIYLPIDFVIEYLNPNFYWDEKESTLTYTTTQDVVRMKSDELNYFVNDEPLRLNMPIIQMEDSSGYIPLDLLGKFCTYSVKYNEELDLLIIDDVKKDSVQGSIKTEKVKLRITKNKNSNYIKKLQLGENVKIYEESEQWYKVRTEEGYIGFLQKDSIVETTNIPGKQEEMKAHSPVPSFDGKVNIVWHQVTNASANSGLMKTIEGASGLDVLSPTWFAISDSDGNISNLADVSYVNWAHDQGYQVWALLSNSFSSTITHDVLSSTEKREKVIKQILALAAIYELDGINIDFESIAKEDGIHYVQFMKELTPYLKKQGLIVSVDLYVPSAWTAHYNRGEIGKIVDYVMIMAYDEHWSGSAESGSVASIGFVEKGIIDTLKEVPKEKIILGLPYYTRLWMEEVVEGEVVVSSKAYSMKKAYEILVENKADIKWDEIVAQYYGEYIIEDITYKIWLEEEKSIEEKVSLAIEYDLAGVSGWKLGLEKDEVWQVLEEYLK